MAGARTAADIGYTEALEAAANAGDLELAVQLERELTLSKILPSDITPLQVDQIVVCYESLLGSLHEAQSEADRDALISSSKTVTTRRLLTALLMVNNPLDHGAPSEPPLRYQHIYRALTNIPARYRMKRSSLYRDGSVLSALHIAHVRRYIAQMEWFYFWTENLYQTQRNRDILSLGLDLLIAAGVILLDKEIRECYRRYHEEPDNERTLPRGEENERQVRQHHWRMQAIEFLEQSGQEYTTPWDSGTWIKVLKDFDDSQWLRYGENANIQSHSGWTESSDDSDGQDTEPEDGGADRNRAIDARVQYVIDALVQDVSVDTIPEDCRDCGICGAPYLGTEQALTEVEEVPVKLPRCEHIFGRNCISLWLAEDTTCPTCRHDYANEL